MGTEENKAVVRRFVEDVVGGRDIDAADDLLAPGYVNLAFEGVDVAGLKSMTAAVRVAVGEVRIGNVELVAEGDDVFARLDYGLTLADGSERTSRVLSYYHLTDGKIDLNDVMMVPDLNDVLGSLTVVDDQDIPRYEDGSIIDPPPEPNPTKPHTVE